MYLPEKLPNNVTVPSGPYHELAEAIRRGCVLRPQQAFGVFAVENDGAQAVCALGAAAVGENIDVISEASFIEQTAELRARFPVLRNLLEMPRNRWSVMEAIIHLNDSRRWSRERIADWLDAL